ncbi:hypothetical protein [Halobacteriovorax sp. JY17]|uniref:hypothetical protein n=1 Tax=Halobacteriovorax sp. JY17 TaxID=2014617 RepID=UPI000C539208|nr:hypothetical protein [Halobacteriovorax sp. JY17]PIK14883.1 MAG: hypothetical protein CES88_11160 [Halobacteriovorax sp. JY17]
MNKIALILLTFSLVSCGKGEGSGVLSKGLSDESVSNSSLIDSSKVMLSPKFYELDIQKFFYKKEVLPSTDKRYVEIQTDHVKEETKLNNLTHSKGLKEILIKGKNLIFSPGNSQGLYEQLNNMTDIVKVTIEAETVDILESMKIPNASLHISSKELNFLNHASIDLTPLGFSQRATHPSNGEVGRDAGEIILAIKKLNFDPQRKSALFILNGGKGQAGSSGIKGANGSRMRDLGGGVVFKREEIESCEVIDNPRFDRVKVNKRLHCSTTIRTEGTNSRPTNGGNAVAGSRPGLGGKGGEFISYIDIPRSLVLLQGGKSGQSAGTIRGGNAGSPTISFHQDIFVNRNGHRVVRSSVRGVSSKGADVISPSALKESGEDGFFDISPLIKNWEGLGYLEKELLYANDLYINNHIERAKESFAKVDKGLSFLDVRKVGVKSTFLKGALSEKLLKINSQRDYYGHSINWVPNYSLEANFSKFKTDLDYSLKTLYLTYWIKNSQKSIESKVEALESFQDSLTEGIEKDKEKYENLISKIPLLKEKIDEFRVEEEYFASEVKRVEAEIERMAKDNIVDRNKVPFLKKALGTVAALSNVIPAGKPALGLIGSSLSIISNNIGSKRPLMDTIKDASSIYNNFSNLKLEESSKNWNEAWSKVKISRVREIKDKKELKEYLSAVTDFSAPILESLKEQAKNWKRREVSSSEISAEIEKIKSTHEVFKKIVKSLEKFMNKKNALVREVNMIQGNISKTLASIYSSFDKISQMSYQKDKLINGGDINITPLLESLEEETKSRILKYHYEVARAYEYRLLRPYLRSINLDIVLEKMKSIVSSDQSAHLSSGDYESLSGLYTSELSSIVDETLSELSREGLPLQREKVLQLNKQEVLALNRGEDIYLDLISEDVFSREMEDIRINNILVEDMNVSNSGELGRSAEISLELAYSGESYIRKGDRTYIFEKDTNAEKTKWGATLDLISGEISSIGASPTAESLVGSLIGTGNIEDLMLLSRPGGLTQLKVRLRKSLSPGVKSTFEGARIRLIYDYNIF